MAVVGYAAAPAGAAPDPAFGIIGRALQARGIAACQTDWTAKSATRDGRANRGERARRSRIVVDMPQPCPPVDPKSGDVYGKGTGRVGVVNVDVFKNGKERRRGVKNYAAGPYRFGYTWGNDVLVSLYPLLLPPGLEQAFVAAMKDLKARRVFERKYGS